MCIHTKHATSRSPHKLISFEL